MPTYAYRCRTCGHEFEKFQKITDPPHARCPVCRSAAERVITGGGGFLLKGEGFYATDYRSESYKKAAKAESSPEGAAASEAEGGGKPEPAGEPPSSGAEGTAKQPGKKPGGAAPKRKRRDESAE